MNGNMDDLKTVFIRRLCSSQPVLTENKKLILRQAPPVTELGTIRVAPAFSCANHALIVMAKKPDIGDAFV